MEARGPGERSAEPTVGRRAGAAIPSAPLMVPAAAPRLPPDIEPDVGAMRDNARRVLAGLGEAEAVVVLAGAGRPGEPGTAEAAPGDGEAAHTGSSGAVTGDAFVYLTESVDLDGFGQHGTGRPVAVHRGLAGRLADATGWRKVEHAPGGLPVDLASLTLQLTAVHAGCSVVPVALSQGACPGRMAAALEDAGLGRLPVVAAGDLSAGLGSDSPRASIGGAHEFDEGVLRALSAGDAEVLAAPGRGEAARVCSRGWAALTVLQHLAGRPPDHLAYRPLRGVGQVVAGWSVT